MLGRSDGVPLIHNAISIGWKLICSIQEAEDKICAFSRAPKEVEFLLEVETRSHHVRHVLGACALSETHHSLFLFLQLSSQTLQHQCVKPIKQYGYPASPFVTK